MPLYGTLAASVALYQGDSFAAFSADSPTTGQASERVSIAFSPADVSPRLALELVFSANPGTFNFQVQDADTDTADAYITPSSGATLTTAQAGTTGKYYARAELVPLMGRFARVICNTQTQNACTVTAKLSR